MADEIRHVTAYTPDDPPTPAEIVWLAPNHGYMVIGQHRLVCDCGRHLPCRHCEDDD
jgi:hypothetical protein